MLDDYGYEAAREAIDDPRKMLACARRRRPARLRIGSGLVDRFDRHLRGAPNARKAYERRHAIAHDIHHVIEHERTVTELRESDREVDSETK